MSQLELVAADLDTTGIFPDTHPAQGIRGRIEIPTRADGTPTPGIANIKRRPLDAATKAKPETERT